MGGTHVGGIRAGLSEELDLTQTFEGAEDMEWQSKCENGPGRAFKAGECVVGVSSLCWFQDQAMEADEWMQK